MPNFTGVCKIFESAVKGIFNRFAKVTNLINNINEISGGRNNVLFANDGGNGFNNRFFSNIAESLIIF